MKKKYKVLLILLILAAVVAVTGSLAAKRAAEASRQTIATDKVTRRTLQSSISATGTVTSDSVTNVYGKVSGAAGLKVKSVRVKPGDKVKKGDVICTFDVSDAEQSLKDAKNAQKKQEEAEEQAKESARKSAEASASAAKKQAQSAARRRCQGGWHGAGNCHTGRAAAGAPELSELPAGLQRPQKRPFPGEIRPGDRGERL